MEKNVILILLILGSFMPVSGQKPTRQSATQAFSNGNYELAYNQFRELLVTFPRDPLYKYYSAACLVNLKRDPDEAERLIKEALNSGSMKSIPDDAVFYLARTKHLQGEYDEAAKIYNRFIAGAGRKRAKDLNVPEFLQECKEHSGELEETTIAAAEPVLEVAPVSKQPLPQSLDTLLAQKLDLQYQADSAEAAENLKKQAPISVIPEPAVADTTKFLQIGPTELKEGIAAKDTTSSLIASEPTAMLTEEIAEVKDTTIKIREFLNKPVGVISVFEILPQPVTDPKATIEINAEPPEGLIYRIQTAVFRNPVQLSYFKGVSPIYGIKAPGATVTTYYAGIFRQSADAAKALTAVRAKGFKDSFVIAQVANKTISRERAAVLEKEWGTKPLFAINERIESQSPDTLPPTLLLKVEVTRSMQPLKEEAVNPMRRMAGKRSFDMMTLDNGSVAYLIGNFITFESADEFAGLLRRNGFQDAKVVAWLGKREIDVQTAKQLFETLK